MLPRFAVSLPHDALLQSTPPFDFPGVSMRVFPLRADMTRVQSLVDGWLNRTLPPEIAYFRAFSPYVTLVALHYGKAAVIPSNLGWSSQREVTFSIPLQWFRRTRRGFELQDMAVITPFIFVDNDLSIPAGREVFGWQKNLIWMDPLADRWMLDPRAPTRHAGISTRAFREVYAGKHEQSLPFVTIEEAPPGATLQYPADRRSPLLPWVALSNAMDAAGGLAQDMIDLLAGLGLVRPRRVPLRGGRTGWLDPGSSAADTLGAVLRAIDPRAADMAGNEINLKQFRDAESPTSACYQDINNTVMRVQEINRLGLLGETRVLFGDISGGYRITLHQWESLPISDMLGLEAVRVTEVDGATVASLKPVLPMWANVDMLYADERHVIAWRSKGQPWTPGPGADPGALRGSPADRRAPRPAPPPPADRPSRPPGKIPYNTALGSSSPVVYGPFETPRATIRVLPLLASEERLAALCDRALNEPLRGPGGGEEGGSGLSFTPWGRHVYLVITTAGETYSVDNNIGSWPSRTMRFLVPVRRVVDGAPDGFALYCPFAFSASTLEAVSGSEINGLNVMSAGIESPASAWLDESGPLPGRGRDLAVLRAMIPPILEAGERARTRTLLTVCQRGTDALASGEEEIHPRWAPRVLHDLARRRAAAPGRLNGLNTGTMGGALPAGVAAQLARGGVSEQPVQRAAEEVGALAGSLELARARAIDLLGDQGRLPLIALKQFRDVARPDRACYRALVEVEQRLVHVERVEEITTPLEVTLFDYESMPIARTLGLVHRSSGYKKGLRYRKIEPVRPFWITAMVREELGRTLAEQQRDLGWARRTEPGSERAPERGAVPEVWSDAERLAMLRRIDLEAPRSIAQLVTVHRGKPGAAPDSPSPAPEAAIARVEPQWVIESLLSREWESRDEPLWLQHQQEIERSAAEARGGVKALTEQAMSEIKELLSQRRRVDGTSHRDVLGVIDELLLPRFVALAWISAEARHLNEIAFAARNMTGDPPLASVASPMPDILHFAGEEADPAPRYSAPDGDGASPLYDKSHFDALESEEPEIVRRAEDVLTRDVAVGGLLRTIMDLCGDSAASVVNEYSNHHTSGSGAVEGSPEDLFLHFAGDGEERGPVTPATEGLPEGLAGDLAKEATATLATARALVFLAWKSTAKDTGGKHAGWTAFVGDATGHLEAARQALILALAKCWQKPFFCVRRDTAGSGAVGDELFPLASCWMDRAGVAWYCPTKDGS